MFSNFRSLWQTPCVRHMPTHNASADAVQRDTETIIGKPRDGTEVEARNGGKLWADLARRACPRMAVDKSENKPTSLTAAHLSVTLEYTWTEGYEWDPRKHMGTGNYIC